MSTVQKLYLKPKNKDVLVPNIETGKPLKAGGELVVDDRFWQRRLKEGDVEIVSAAALSKSEAKSKAAQK